MRLQRVFIVSLAVIAAFALTGCNEGQQAGGGLTSSGGIGVPGGTEVTEVGDQEVADDDGVIANPDEVQVEPIQVEITTSTLGTTAMVGKNYKKFLHAKGGSCGKKQCTYNWELQGLPEGLSLTGCSKDPSPAVTGSKACIEGAPTADGSFDVSIRAADKDDATLFGSKVLTLVVNPAPSEPTPQSNNDFISVSAVSDKLGISKKPDLTIVLDGPKPLDAKWQAPGAPPVINVQGNVDLSIPLYLKFHAEGGCGGYQWPAGINPYPTPAPAEWTFKMEKCNPSDVGEGPNYCQKWTNILPWLSDFNRDPIHHIEAIVQDSCGNVAKKRVKLIYKYPADEIAADNRDGPIKFCGLWGIAEVGWGKAGQQVNFWLTGAKDGVCEGNIHTGDCDVATWQAQFTEDTVSMYVNLQTQTMTTVLPKGTVLKVSDASDLANFYTFWLSVGQRGCVVSGEPGCPDKSNPNFDVAWIKGFTKHWWFLFFDDRNGQLLYKDEERFDRDLSYGFDRRNWSGGIWLRRPIVTMEHIGGKNIGCQIPEYLLGGPGEEMLEPASGTLAPPACSPMPECAKGTSTLPPAVDSEHPPQQ